MLVYVQVLLNIVLRRAGPEDLPDSPFLFGATLIVFVLLQIPLALLTYGAQPVALQTVVASIGLLFAGLWALLVLTGYRSRFRQTITAMLGTSALLTAISTPFSFWRQSSVDLGLSAALPSIVIFGIIVWSIVIDGHILARALSRPFVVGLLVAIAYFFLHTTILIELVPPDMTG